MAAKPITEDKLKRAREALGSFLAAALRSTSPEELAALPGPQNVQLEVPAAAVRRALLVYEDELEGGSVSKWIEHGRSVREAAATDSPGVDPSAPYRLEIAGADGPRVFACRDLSEVRRVITAAALDAVEAVETALGLEPGAEAGGGLAATLGRQAYRRLVGDLREYPGEEATFDLPDRPWLRLADPLALAGAASA